MDETSTKNPDLRKELLMQEDALSGSPTLLRKDDNRKSGKALTNPLKGKVQSESAHTVKTSAGAVYRKSDIAKSKIVFSEPQEETTKEVNASRSPHGDETKTKSRKKEVEIQPQSSDSDDLPGSPERSNLKNMETPFQDSQYYVTSKDTEINGGINLAGKRAKPNNTGPVLENSKTSGNKGVKQGTKKQTGQEARKKKAVEIAQEATLSRDNDLDILPPTVETGLPSTSTPKESSDESKDITRHTPDDKILKRFESRDLTTKDWKDWNKLADQALARGVQKAAEEILKSSNAEEEFNINAPPGFSDESGDSEATVKRSDRSTKNKGQSRYGNSYKHSVKLVTSEQDLVDLSMAALEAYRIKLANFRSDVNKPEKSKLGFLEKHLFRRKYGSEALDISKSWNASWRVPLNFDNDSPMNSPKK